MNTYHKIQTVFLRNPEDNYKTLLENQFSKPEFEYLQFNDWIVDEKIDGTNIRVLWDGIDFEVRGKTDNAQLHVDLIKNIQSLFTKDAFAEQFGQLGELTGMSKTGPGSFEIHEEPLQVCLYGEGYGPGIQKGGGNYRDDKGFILFDVKVGNSWLSRENVKDIANNLGVDVVPELDVMHLDEAVELCKTGFKSKFGDFLAEGIVARPAVEMFNKRGERIITKLKTSDYLCQK